MTQVGSLLTGTSSDATLGSRKWLVVFGDSTFQESNPSTHPHSLASGAHPKSWKMAECLSFRSGIKQPETSSFR